MATSKLSLQERLTRKRNAARLRQQRCRARKRQALVERAALRRTVTSTPPPTEAAPKSPPRLPPRKLWKSRIGSLNPHADYWSDDCGKHIHARTVSFDSDNDRSRAGSFDSIYPSNTFESPKSSNATRMTSPSSVNTAASCSPVHFVHKLPNKEETAIDAMLSLQKSCTKLYRPIPTIIRAPAIHGNCWNPMLFQARPRLMPRQMHA